MRYRKDIEGLRALAVLPVVLFHFEVPFFPGGFVGVDIFFVISGFLITSLINEEMRDGRFSVFAFYKRRVARILPALSLVLLATLAAAWLLFLPLETVGTARGVLAAMLSAANVYFWSETGYFDADATGNPVLHTWSLSVEEQFYIVFPVLLAAAYRFHRRALKPLVWTIAGASLLACVTLTPHHPTASFYLLPTRAWELAAGALLAMGCLPAIAGRFRGSVAALGMLLIAVAVFGLDAEMKFPGAYALIPVAGAVCILAAAPGTPAGTMLSAPLLAYIGRISYALYLWHWPIRVFYVSTVRPLDFSSTVWLIAASFVVADLSTRLVEQPLRRRINGLPVGRVIFGAAVSIGAVSLLAANLPNIAKATRALPPEVARITAFINYKVSKEVSNQFRRGTCMLDRETDRLANFDQATCLRTAEDRPDYLIIGDSHAAHIWRGLSLAFPELNFLQATASGCRPTLHARGEPRCTELMGFMFESFIPRARPDAVILAGRWRERDLADLVETVRTLTAGNSQIIVFGPTVEYLEQMPLLLAHDLYWGTNRTPDYRDRSRLRLDRRMKALLPGARYVSMQDVICPADHCLTMAGDVPLQFDYGHFTLAGATEIARRLRDGGALP